jgi:hypothetical protein
MKKIISLLMVSFFIISCTNNKEIADENNLNENKEPINIEKTIEEEKTNEEDKKVIKEEIIKIKEIINE